MTGPRNGLQQSFDELPHQNQHTRKEEDCQDDLLTKTRLQDHLNERKCYTLFLHSFLEKKTLCRILEAAMLSYVTQLQSVITAIQPHAGNH